MESDDNNVTSGAGPCARCACAARVKTRLCTYVYIYVYMYICICIYTYIYIYIYFFSTPAQSKSLVKVLLSARGRCWLCFRACGPVGQRGARESGAGRKRKSPEREERRGRAISQQHIRLPVPPWHVNTCPTRAAAHFRPGSGVFNDLRRGSGVGEEGWCTLRNRRPSDVQL